MADIDTYLYNIQNATYGEEVRGSIHDALKAINDDEEAFAHSRIFRGKNLGSVVTDEQKAAIRDGTFKDIFLGDYWSVANNFWRIVDMDYWYNTGPYNHIVTTHHLVIIPDKLLYYHVMNDSGTTTGGYVGSKMYADGLTEAKTIINNIFGDAVLEHREYLSNAATDGIITGMISMRSTVEIPSEIMIYGTNIFSPINDGTYMFRGQTYCRTQLALFDIAPRFINIERDTFWLRDVVSSDRFAALAESGLAYSYPANQRFIGVRPYFCIG